MKKYYKNMSLPIKASMYYMLGNIIQQSVNLLITPILTRILSEYDYGIINIYNSWKGIIVVIATLGLTNGIYNNAMIDFEEDIDEVTSSMLILTTLSVLILWIISLVFRNQITNLMGLSIEYINIMFLSIALNPALSFWMAKERFNYRYKMSFFISLVITIFGSAISIFMIIFSDSNKSFYKILGNAMITIIIGAILHFKLIFKGRKLYSKGYWKYSIKFGMPLIPHYLSNIILSQSDKIIIGKIIGAVEAGLYGLAYSASSVFNVVISAINVSWIPWTLKNIKSGNIELINKVSKVMVIVCALICYIFISLSPEIMKIIAAPKFYEAIWVMPPVVIGIYFTFLNSLFGNIQFYYKKTKFIMITSVLAALFNIITNLVFIPIYGYIAAAYTTVFSYIILTLIQYKFMLIIDINNKNIYDVKFIFKVTIILILSSAIMVKLYVYNIIRYLILLNFIILVVLKRKIFFKLIKEIRKR